MKSEFTPQSFAIAAFAQNHGNHVGVEKLGLFPRLIEESQGQSAETLVHYTVSGETRMDAAGHHEPWLHLQAQTQLRLTCQRCLATVDIPLEFAQDFRFVATEALAEIEDEESEEDVLVLSKTFNLLHLIEDELLMAIPLVPKHTVCPTPVQLTAIDAGFEAQSTEKAHPFAALEQLKNKP